MLGSIKPVTLPVTIDEIRLIGARQRSIRSQIRTIENKIRNGTYSASHGTNLIHRLQGELVDLDRYKATRRVTDGKWLSVPRRVTRVTRLAPAKKYSPTLPHTIPKARDPWTGGSKLQKINVGVKRATDDLMRNREKIPVERSVTKSTSTSKLPTTLRRRIQHDRDNRIKPFNSQQNRLLREQTMMRARAGATNDIEKAQQDDLMRNREKIPVERNVTKRVPTGKVRNQLSKVKAANMGSIGGGFLKTRNSMQRLLRQ